MMDEPWFSIIVLVARILLALVFLVSGIDKAVHYARAVDEFKTDNIPLPQTSVVFTVVLHVIASTCLIVGWHVLEMSIALVIFTLVATALVHDFWNMKGTARLGRSRIALANLGLVGGLLLLAATGPGSFVAIP